MKTLSDLTERIFAHAALLHQTGRLKNTIHAFEKKIYILNSDQTVLIRFDISDSDNFTTPVSFSANDYDSKKFEMRDGKIVFVSEQSAGFVREKFCGVPKIEYKGVDKIFNSHLSSVEKKEMNRVKLSKGILDHLDDSLSHIEISGEDNHLIIIQRDIYGGSIIKITRKNEKQESAAFFDLSKIVSKDFGPLGVRTNDFSVLFSLQDEINFSFFPGDPDGQSFCFIEGDKIGMVGFIAGCLYDEIGTTKQSKEKDNGRKKPQDRRGKQKASTKVIKANEKQKQKTVSKRQRSGNSKSGKEKAKGLF